MRREPRTKGRVITRMAVRGLKTVGLFAGIGGIEHGLERAGHETRLLVEVDPAARAVLQARFPHVEVHDAIRTLRALPSDTDLVTAGFPCQDLSQAGKTAGIDGTRSGLVGEVFRLLESHRAPWVLIENVPFMLRLGRGKAIAEIVSRLEALGYRWAYRTIDTRAFGLPQRRLRVYLLASRDDDPGAVLFRGDHPFEEPTYSPDLACGFYWTEGNRGLGWAVNAVPTLKGGSTIGIPSPPAIWMPDGRIVTPDIRDAERLQGFDIDWTAPAEDVVRPGHRWRLVGNAVTVDVAEWIGSGIRGDVLSRSVPRQRHEGSGGWPSAVALIDGRRYQVGASTWPVCRSRSVRLDDFLRRAPALLSHRATSGFRRRLANSTLRYPHDFLDVLDAHVRRLSEHAAMRHAS